MKDSRSCPKCESADVVRIPGEARSMSGAAGNYVAASVFSHVLVSRFLCCECGYSEEWVESPEDRERLKERYQDK